jgi:hypothetical protein
MIVILYVPEYRSIAESILQGIHSEAMDVYLMSTDSIDIGALSLAKTIVFGCPIDIPDSYTRFMYRTRDIALNDGWANKMATNFNLEREFHQKMCIFAGNHRMLWIPQQFKQESAYTFGARIASTTRHLS